MRDLMAKGEHSLQNLSEDTKHKRDIKRRLTKFDRALVQWDGQFKKFSLIEKMSLNSKCDWLKQQRRSAGGIQDKEAFEEEHGDGKIIWKDNLWKLEEKSVEFVLKKT